MSEKQKHIPSEDECERKGMILREGYTKKPYHRKAYSRHPPNDPNAPESEMIYVQATDILKETEVSPACVPDVGEKGKTPKEKKWSPPLEKGGISQFFDDNIMAYDQESCVKAGIRANKFNQPYSEISQKFVIQSNFRINSNPEQAKKFEECRQNVLIGYDPTKDPTIHKGKSKVIQDVKVDIDTAKLMREKWKPIIDQED